MRGHTPVFRLAGTVSGVFAGGMGERRGAGPGGTAAGDPAAHAPAAAPDGSGPRALESLARLDPEGVDVRVEPLGRYRLRETSGEAGP